METKRDEISIVVDYPKAWGDDKAAGFRLALDGAARRYLQERPTPPRLDDIEGLTWCLKSLQEDGGALVDRLKVSVDISSTLDAAQIEKINEIMRGAFMEAKKVAFNQ